VLCRSVTPHNSEDKSDSGCATRTPAEQGSCTFYFSTHHLDETRHALKVNGDSAAKLLTRDVVRRIAGNIAKLPKLLKRAT